MKSERQRQINDVKISMAMIEGYIEIARRLFEIMEFS